MCRLHAEEMLGGLDTAKYVVQHACRPSVSSSTIKSHWSRYNSAAIFLYLILTQDFPLQPPEITSAEFVDDLLQQANNFDELRRFFSAYQCVRAALSASFGYNQFVSLNLPFDCPPPHLSAPPFSAEELKFFVEWVKLP